MALFMLDTDTVSSAKSSMDSIASQINSIASSVSGYDTSCEDFDFGSAKSVIASNIEAFGIKVQNTGTVMDNVVSSHTALQGSLKFGAAANTSTENTGTDTTNTTNTTDTTSTTYSGSYTSGTYNGGSAYTGGGYYQAPAIVTTEPVTDTEDASHEIVEKVTKISHEKIDTSSLTGDAKKIFDEVKYTEAGYAVYGGMLVIAASSAFGKVGDILEFSLKDGTKLRCIIGNTLADGSGEIKFIVNDKWKEEAEGNLPTNLLDNIDKVHNYGSNSSTLDGTINLGNLPAIGQYTSKWDTLGDSWTIVTSKADVPRYSSYVQGRISQNADKAKFNDKCLSFAETHAYALYTGNTGDSAERASNYPHGSAFTSWFSDSKQDTLAKVYSEIVSGRPVVIQVNGNKAGTSRHFVTVVGFRNSITDPKALTEDDLLIIDSWDGKLERMDQDNSRFLTNGAQCRKKYSGYYLRVLKS